MCNSCCTGCIVSIFCHGLRRLVAVEKKSWINFSCAKCRLCRCCGDCKFPTSCVAAKMTVGATTVEKNITAWKQCNNRTGTNYGKKQWLMNANNAIAYKKCGHYLWSVNESQSRRENFCNQNVAFIGAESRVCSRLLSVEYHRFTDARWSFGLTTIYFYPFAPLPADCTVLYR